MNTTAAHDEKMAKLTLASVYPHYINKLEKKGRTAAEFKEVFCWLTGFDENQLQQIIAEKWTFEKLFSKANLHKDSARITGVICGYRIEAIENELTRNVRYLDKLVDELSKGKTMEKVLRSM
jgi:hypothetical protein